MEKKSLFWPVMIGTLILAIIIYLVASVKQPFVTCSIRHNNDGAIIEERITTTFNSGTISSINYNKTITLTGKYQNVGFSKSLKSSFHFSCFSCSEYHLFLLLEDVRGTIS